MCQHTRHVQPSLILHEDLTRKELRKHLDRSLIVLLSQGLNYL